MPVALPPRAIRWVRPGLNGTARPASSWFTRLLEAHFQSRNHKKQPARYRVLLLETNWGTCYRPVGRPIPAASRTCWP